MLNFHALIRVRVRCFSFNSSRSYKFFDSIKASLEVFFYEACHIWGIALGMANDRLARERETLEAARQEIEAQRREAAELADQVSADLEAARIQIAQQAQALKQAEAQAAQLAAAQAVLAEVQKRADSFAAMLEAEREATKHAQAKAETAIAEAANLAGKLEALSKQKTVAKKI
jgi:chromosome segregation ATPase